MMELSYRRHRFPPVVIQHAVWLYLRFTLSYRDVEDLLAERGFDVSNETVRSWVLKFGPVIARRLRQRRPRPSDRWHLDEMVVRIAGKRMYLWRAVDHEGEVLDMLVQRRRDTQAALRLMRKTAGRGIIMTDDDRGFMDIAIAQALLSAGEDGIPVGAALAWRGVLIAKGHNQRQQKRVITLHGETDCLTNAGLFGRWRETTLYTTLCPCMMCAGTIVQFKIPRVVIADTVNFEGTQAFLRDHGVEVDIINDT